MPRTTWPTRPDGTPRTIEELTAADRFERLLREANAKLQADLQNPETRAALAAVFVSSTLK